MPVNEIKQAVMYEEIKQSKPCVHQQLTPYYHFSKKMTLYTWRQFAPVFPSRCHNTFMIIAHSPLQKKNDNRTIKRITINLRTSEVRRNWDSAPTIFWWPGQCQPSRSREDPTARRWWHLEPAFEKKKPRDRILNKSKNPKHSSPLSIYLSGIILPAVFEKKKNPKHRSTRKHLGIKARPSADSNRRKPQPSARFPAPWAPWGSPPSFCV